MKNCIVHVTDREYPEILQLNHDAYVWSTEDETLMEGLVTVLGEDVVDQLREYDECRMQPHHSIEGLPRVEEDMTETATAQNLMDR